MPDPRIVEFPAELAVAAIEEGSRLRVVSEAGVESLIASIEALGAMKDPIHVRRVRHRDNALVLIAGGHRLEAARRLGWATITAKVWEMNDDQASLMEIDDNLAGAEMDVLDTARFLATRKEVYERLHPETARGVAGALARHSATDMMSVASFVTTTAEKFGQSERNIRRLVSAGSRLTGPDYTALRSAPKPVTLKDLTVIAKADPTDRYEIVRMLGEGAARNAMDASRKIAAAGRPDPALQDPVERGAIRLLNAFSAQKKAVQKRFVRMARPQLEALMDQLDEMEDV